MIIKATKAGSKIEAYAEEARLIAHYGRKDLKTGCLINLTNGKGSTGRVWADEQRAKVAAATKHQEWGRQRRKQQSDRMLGNKNLLGHKHSDETRAKISKAVKGKKLKLSVAERQRRAEAVAARNRLYPWRTIGHARH